MTVTSELSAALASRYVIARQIGRGGMATVYLAHDLKHDRDVALKVLNPELGAALGAERFLSEIKTTATLQHPNLLPLFDSGEANGLLYYVMPYVEGETLRARIEREGQLPVDDAVRIGLGIARALSYAHARGVIHRDLKPENILLQHGEPLVLDFGIALAMRNAGGARVTATGISIGTPSYMSPEQAAGERIIDARADIFTLGTVMYEMLAGELPHAGPTAQSIIAKLMSADARSLGAVRRTVPQHVVDAVDKALSRVPADRFATADEFARALQTTSETSAVRHATRAAEINGTPQVRSSRKGVALAWAVAAIALASSAWISFKPVPGAPVTRLDLTVGPARIVGNDVVISGDGAMLVYAGYQPNGQSAVYLRHLNGDPDFRMLAGTESGRFPAFSPDDKWIVFRRESDGALAKVSVDGGAVNVIANVEESLQPHWGVDSLIVYTGPPGVFVIPAIGGTPRALRGLGGRRPFFLPDGSGVLGLRDNDAVLYDLRTDSMTVLVRNAAHPVYVATGHLLYVDERGGLFAVPFDLRKHEITGKAVRVLDRVAATAGARGFSVSNTGTLVQHEGTSLFGTMSPSRFVIKTFGGNDDTVALPAAQMGQPRVSPDGRQLAYLTASTRTASYSNIYTLDLASGTNTQLTFDGENTAVVWSPDGKRIAFNRYAPSQGWSVNVKRADNTGSDSTIFRSATQVRPTAWPRADMLLITSGALAGSADLLTVSPTAGSTPSTYVNSQWQEEDMSLSPDGTLAVFAMTQRPGSEIWIREFPNAVGQWKVSPSGGVAPRWSHDGQYVYYWKAATNDTLFRVRVQRTPAVVVRPPEAVATVRILGVQQWDLFPDDKRFVINTPVSPTAVVDASTDRYVVTLNWLSTLKATVKAGSK
jgi:eukaryotic-like serine/threonine-protein kinase